MHSGSCILLVSRSSRPTSSVRRKRCCNLPHLPLPGRRERKPCRVFRCHHRRRAGWAHQDGALQGHLSQDRGKFQAFLHRRTPASGMYGTAPQHVVLCCVVLSKRLTPSALAHEMKHAGALVLSRPYPCGVARHLALPMLLAYLVPCAAVSQFIHARVSFFFRFCLMACAKAMRTKESNAACDMENRSQEHWPRAGFF